ILMAVEFLGDARNKAASRWKTRPDMHQTRLMECFKLYIDLILEVIRAYEPHKAGILRPLARSPLVQLLTTAWIDSVVALHVRDQIVSFFSAGACWIPQNIIIIFSLCTPKPSLATDGPLACG
ncbi:hypothetical protein MJO29_014903, partial [Puccinia striiformis f. sp. tritici]